MVRAQHLLELAVDPLVEVERIAESAERPHVTAEASRGLQRVRVIGAQDLRLRPEHLGIEIVGALKAPLRTQHVGDLKPQVQGLPVVRPDRIRPLLLEPLPHLEGGLELAAPPEVAHSLDEQLTGVGPIAPVRLRGDQVRPDQVVPRPVLRIVDVILSGPRADQDPVHSVHRVLAVLPRFHLRANGRLDEPMHLDRVAAPVDLGQRVARDVPDQLAQDGSLAQPGVVREQGLDHLIAVHQRQRDRVGREVGAQLK